MSDGQIESSSSVKRRVKQAIWSDSDIELSSPPSGPENSSAISSPAAPESLTVAAGNVAGANSSKEAASSDAQEKREAHTDDMYLEEPLKARRSRLEVPPPPSVPAVTHKKRKALSNNTAKDSAPLSASTPQRDGGFEDPPAVSASAIAPAGDVAAANSSKEAVGSDTEEKRRAHTAGMYLEEPSKARRSRVEVPPPPSVPAVPPKKRKAPSDSTAKYSTPSSASAPQRDGGSQWVGTPLPTSTPKKNRANGDLAIERPSASQPPAKRSKTADSVQIEQSNRLSASQPAPSTPKPSQQTNWLSASKPAPSPPKPSQQQREISASFLARNKRHQDFWHLDGSVVILIEKRLFKLHRSRLSHASAYFAKLFEPLGIKRESVAMDEDDDSIVEVSRPAGEDGEGLLSFELEGCPIFRVKCVSVSDFEALLNALDGGIMFAFSKPQFPVIASLLRSSRALSVSIIKDYALQYLCEMWSSNLEDLCPADKAGVLQKHAEEALVLSYDCDLPEIRKRAFYELLRSPTFCRGPQGSEDEDEDFFAREDLSGESDLSAADLLRLTYAREQLARAWHLTARAPPPPSRIPCELDQQVNGAGPNDSNADARVVQKAKACEKARSRDVQNWATHVTQSAVAELALLDPIGALYELAEVDWEDMGFCVACAAARREEWEDKRADLWDKMDRWAGVPEPEEEKEEAPA